MPFAVLGHPIGHTLSPVMHNAAFESLNMDAIYLAFDVHPRRLLKVLEAMSQMGFRGVNLTIPLKEVAFRGLKDLDISSRRLGSVNTIQFRHGGKLKGYSTDGKGFLEAVREAFARPVAGMSIFILGTGGAGRAVALACAARNASAITLADIETARARRVASEIARMFPRVRVQCANTNTVTWKKECADADLVVQATPVGMKKTDTSLLPESAFRKGQMAYDLVYMYPQTAFMKAARKGGAKTSNGLGMLLHQGALSFEIWTGIKPPVEVMRKALEKRVYKGI
jgi:shikimate dehydrogenase